MIYTKMYFTMYICSQISVFFFSQISVFFLVKLVCSVLKKNQQNEYLFTFYLIYFLYFSKFYFPF